ncbi:MAG TPA: methyltransferase domain-containing protein [Longimicrobiales bacterium]|nr:methyltransferase domain-containing protein [Longimicrobiales bacterium]
MNRSREPAGALDDLQRYYAAGAEAERLSLGAGQLERARTQEILARFLPPPPARVLDVGGGTGVYSLWLLGRGYEVELIDPVPLHVEQATAAFEAAGLPHAVARLGDARRLDQADGSVDAALLLGPLYHLTERADRLAALGEVRRVLRPGGVLVAAAISRFASLLDGYARDLVGDPAFVEIVERDLRDGQHRNPTARPDYFTTAFFHRPRQLREEVEAAGLIVDALLAVEGPFWIPGGFDALWADPARRQRLLEFLRRIETEESLLGVSAHLLVVARKA